MSSTRNACGSSQAANIPVTASEIAASCSAVRRSAAILAMLTSSVRRASNIWVCVNPCKAANKLNRPFDVSTILTMNSKFSAKNGRSTRDSGRGYHYDWSYLSNRFHIHVR